MLTNPATGDVWSGGVALGQLLQARAVELARAGHYASAEALLADMPDRDASASAVDLLARIRAQQGRLSEADSLWRQALRLDPGNDTFRAGLERVHALQAGGRIPWDGIAIGVSMLVGG